MLFLSAITLFALIIAGYIALLWRLIKLAFWVLSALGKGLYRLARAGNRYRQARRLGLNRGA